MMKIEAAVRNARGFLAIQEEFGSFNAYFKRRTPDTKTARRRY